MEAHESAAKGVSISTKKSGDEGLQGHMLQTVLRWILFFSVNCRLPMPTRTKDFKEVSLKMVCQKKTLKNVPLRCGHAVLLLPQGNEGPRSI
jgi:hypothetical protein